MDGTMSTCPTLNLQPSVPSLFDPQALKDEISRLTDIVVNLEAKVSALEATRDSQVEKITALELTQVSQAENELNMLRLINDLKGDGSEAPNPTKKTKDLINKLYSIMSERKAQEFSIDQAAFALKISKRQMNRLKTPISKDSRFVVGWLKTKAMRGQKGVIIRIQQYIK